MDEDSPIFLFIFLIILFFIGIAFVLGKEKNCELTIARNQIVLLNAEITALKLELESCKDNKF